MIKIIKDAFENVGPAQILADSLGALAILTITYGLLVAAHVIS